MGDSVSLEDLSDEQLSRLRDAFVAIIDAQLTEEDHRRLDRRFVPRLDPVTGEKLSLEEREQIESGERRLAEIECPCGEEHPIRYELDHPHRQVFLHVRCPGRVMLRRIPDDNPSHGPRVERFERYYLKPLYLGHDVSMDLLWRHPEANLYGQAIHDLTRSWEDQRKDDNREVLRD